MISDIISFFINKNLCRNHSDFKFACRFHIFVNINKIDISTLKSGLYYLEVIDNKGRSVVGKFVVE